MFEQEKNAEQKQTNEYEEKMAVNFPEWDLMPPDILIKRSCNE